MSIPTLLVLGMFCEDHSTVRPLRDVPGNAMVIEVQAAWHHWSFRYADLRITSEELCVPVGQPVKLELRADETGVVHSFYLPGFRKRMKRIPDAKGGYLCFRPEQEGAFAVFCGAHCGRDRDSMTAKLQVLTRTAYEAWVAEQIARKNGPVDIEKALDPSSREILDRDAPMLYATHCISCHGAKGQGGLVEGARDFTKATGWKRSTKVTDVYRTLSEGIEGTRMRAFVNLRPWDRFALAHYVVHFNPSGSPEPTDEEVARLVVDYEIAKEVEPQATISIERAMQLIAEEASPEGR